MSRKRAREQWTREEDLQLELELKSGMSVSEMSKIHERTKGSIISRSLFMKRHSELSELKICMETKDSNETKKIEKIEEIEENKEIELEFDEGSGEYIIVFDTETTGLEPKNKNGIGIVKPEETYKWEKTRVVQFAYEMYTLDGQFVSKDSFYVKPTWTFDMPQGAFDAHHITKEMLEQGITHREFITRIIDLFNQARTLVGHNVNFDCRVILSELYRDFTGRQFVKAFTGINRQCTCEMARQYLIFEDNWDKPYQLAIVYQRLALPDLDESKLHSADYDVKLCSSIFFNIMPHTGKRIYLRVNCKSEHYKEHNLKHCIKRLGGYYDMVNNQWFIHDSNPFKQCAIQLFGQV